MKRFKVPETSLEGLKEIGNLASWTVSTAKPGNGIEQLRDEDTSLFWQQVPYILPPHYVQPQTNSNKL